MKLISDYKKLVLKLLLQDPKISEMVLTHGEIPQSIEVHDDGSVTFGRTPRHWWNYIFGDKKTYEFRELSTMMLTAYNKYLPPGSGLDKILTQEIIENAYTNNNYEMVIDKFTMYAFLGVTDGAFKLNKLKLIDADPRQQPNARGSKTPKGCVGSTTAYMDLGGGEIPFTIHLYGEE